MCLYFIIINIIKNLFLKLSISDNCLYSGNFACISINREIIRRKYNENIRARSSVEKKRNGESFKIIWLGVF